MCVCMSEAWSEIVCVCGSTASDNSQTSIDAAAQVDVDEPVEDADES